MLIAAAKCFGCVIIASVILHGSAVRFCREHSSSEQVLGVIIASVIPHGPASQFCREHSSSEQVQGVVIDARNVVDLWLLKFYW